MSVSQEHPQKLEGIKPPTLTDCKNLSISCLGLPAPIFGPTGSSLLIFVVWLLGFLTGCS